MKHISLLKNTIQEYAWGSRTAISELLGEATPSEKPQAELWMGAHPKAPSQVFIDGTWKPLDQVIQGNPEKILGSFVARRFNSRLPFLFKVLAAAKPLSIQAHPDALQAKEGYERENRLKIPLNAPSRNYRDENHKPECICALTPFWALKGFRKIQDILSGMKQCCPKPAAPEIQALSQRPNAEGLKEFFRALMTLPSDRKKTIIQQSVETAKRRIQDDPMYKWILSLHKDYPTDIGILSPVFLNLICLNPQEALYLSAGELHAYLEGVGIELMANSDNVLRGGLTSKHVDVPELLKVLNFQESNVRVLLPQMLPTGESRYTTPAEEFELSVVDLHKCDSYISPKKRSAEILLCICGVVKISDSAQGDLVELQKGRSVFIPASVHGYKIEGEAILYKASVPIPENG